MKRISLWHWDSGRLMGWKTNSWWAKVSRRAPCLLQQITQRQRYTLLGGRALWDIQGLLTPPPRSDANQQLETNAIKLLIMRLDNKQFALDFGLLANTSLWCLFNQIMALLWRFLKRECNRQKDQLDSLHRGGPTWDHGKPNGNIVTQVGLNLQKN